MSRRERLVFSIIGVVIIVAVVYVLAVVYVSFDRARQSSHTINVNGQAVDLTNAKSIMIESQEGVQYFDADSISGAVTVTKSTVTVTIWMKP